MFYYVLYVSKASKLMSDQDLKDILEESVKWNSSHGITGMLLYVKGNFWKSVKRDLVTVQSGRFVQVLEGQRAEVEEILNLIKTDNRHHELTVLSRTGCEKRYFQNWAMGFKSLELEEFKSMDGFFELDDDFLSADSDQANIPLNFIKSFYDRSKVKL